MSEWGRLQDVLHDEFDRQRVVGVDVDGVIEAIVNVRDFFPNLLVASSSDELRAALDVDALEGALFYVYGNVTRRGASIGPDRPGPREGYRPEPFWAEDARLVADKYTEYLHAARLDADKEGEG